LFFVEIRYYSTNEWWTGEGGNEAEGFVFFEKSDFLLCFGERGAVQVETTTSRDAPTVHHSATQQS
jgi:hypothetical protein